MSSAHACDHASKRARIVAYSPCWQCLHQQKHFLSLHGLAYVSTQTPNGAWGTMHAAARAVEYYACSVPQSVIDCSCRAVHIV
eukprot:18691-Heterococcus_DN1.PRE.2